MSPQEQAPTFDLRLAVRQVELAVKPYPKAALFELSDRGYGTAFEQLVACIVSIRTYDEVMLPIALEFFAQARTPAAVVALGVDGIEKLIARSTFADNKARQIHEIARRVVAEHGGVLPADREVLLSFRGVGPKCANLVMGIVGGEPHIGVDIHVHRVTNRWGYVNAPTPEKTLAALEQKAPRDLWVTLNRILVPFGKHLCTGTLPACNSCPIREMCARVGVTSHR